MFGVRQNFPRTPPLDLRAVINKEFAKVRSRIKPGTRIAVGVGSRGISHLVEIITAVLDQLRGAGAQPFIIPAMGSHGGATPEGQTKILAGYGITEAAMKVSIRASLEVREVGKSAEGVPVYCSVEALSADGIVIVNRVKPHTDFTGKLGSGIQKMCVVGLGKRTGAAAMHAAASRSIGHEAAIRGIARVLIEKAPILCGVALIENQFHDTAKIVVLPREEIESGEEKLFVESSRLMARLPFEELDLLIVDRIGKNVSGAGMDPNVTGRWVDGYSSLLRRGDRPAPFIRRIFVRDLTPETDGNAIGICLADVTTTRLVRAMNSHVTGINALTSLTPHCAKTPVHFETDREALDLTLTSLALQDSKTARVVRVPDTLTLTDLVVSESLRDEVKKHSDLTVTSEPAEMPFDGKGNLCPAFEH